MLVVLLSLVGNCYTSFRTCPYKQRDPRPYRRDEGKKSRQSSTTQPNRGKTLQLRTALICGMRRKALRDFKNLRTQTGVQVPAALDQRPQTVCARRVFRPGRSVAPQHGLQHHPIRLLATERNLTSEYLCLCGNSYQMQCVVQTVHDIPQS